jgi:hypothetical protein
MSLLKGTRASFRPSPRLSLLVVRLYKTQNHFKKLLLRPQHPKPLLEPKGALRKPKKTEREELVRLFGY